MHICTYAHIYIHIHERTGLASHIHLMVSRMSSQHMYIEVFLCVYIYTCMWGVCTHMIQNIDAHDIYIYIYIHICMHAFTGSYMHQFKSLRNLWIKDDLHCDQFVQSATQTGRQAGRQTDWRTDRHIVQGTLFAFWPVFAGHWQPWWLTWRELGHVVYFSREYLVDLNPPSPRMRCSLV